MITTSCNGCSFAEMDGSHQVGCSIGVLQRLEDSGAKVTVHEENGKTHKQVERVCMYRRYDWDWDKDIYDEVFIKSNFIVLHDKNSKEELTSTLSSIAELETPKPAKVIVCHTTDNLSEIYKLGTDIIGKKNFTCVQMLEITYTDCAYDEAFKRVKNGWTFFINSGTVLEKDTLNILNHAVNYDMKTFVGTSDIECYIGSVYKYLRGQKHGSIKDKLQYIDPTSVVDWKQLDEAYRLYKQQN